MVLEFVWLSCGGGEKFRKYSICHEIFKENKIYVCINFSKMRKMHSSKTIINGVGSAFPNTI